MKNAKQFVVALALVFGFAAQAQDNIFLSQDFWKTNPTIATIDAKIKAGHSLSEFNANTFNGIVYAILQDVSLKTIKHCIAVKGNDVNKLTHDGRTYIFWAANKGNVKLMKYLLSKGAKTDILDDKGSSILNYAAGSGQTNTKVYDVCLANGANLEKDLTPYGANALLLVAQHSKDFTLLNYFTNKGLSLESKDNEGNGVFNYAVKGGDIGMLKQLITKGITGDDNAFITASQGKRRHTNSIEVFRYLESIGLNPKVVTSTGETPLHGLASKSKDGATISYFIEKGVDVNQEDKSGTTAFLNAAQRNDLEIVRTLFKEVSNINHKNRKGESALALAVAYNTPEVVTFLLANEADVMVTDVKGNTLASYLMQSFNAGKQDAFKHKFNALSTKGLDVAKVQENGNTLFHLALDTQTTQAVKFAAGLKADVNAKNNEGLTPLHKAAMLAKNAETLTYLVSIGAKKDAVTDFDETAYDLALENEILSANNIPIDFLK